MLPSAPPTSLFEPVRLSAKASDAYVRQAPPSKKQVFTVGGDEVHLRLDLTVNPQTNCIDGTVGAPVEFKDAASAVNLVSRVARGVVDMATQATVLMINGTGAGNNHFPVSIIPTTGKSKHHEQMDYFLSAIGTWDTSLGPILCITTDGARNRHKMAVELYRKSNINMPLRVSHLDTRLLSTGTGLFFFLLDAHAPTIPYLCFVYHSHLLVLPPTSQLSISTCVISSRGCTASLSPRA
jgi:hypothetical protein